MISWNTASTQSSKRFKCGFCGTPVASEKGFTGQDHRDFAFIYICHECTKPTFFDTYNNQFPAPALGNQVLHIPNEDVDSLFSEAKSCFSIAAYTSSVMCCRKLLMNISVAEGAEEGKSYQEYVNYLNENGYIPPKGKAWVDKIRKLGNEANHKIELKTSDEATLILNFTEMLLRFVYEMPGILKGNDQDVPG